MKHGHKTRKSSRGNKHNRRTRGHGGASKVAPMDVLSVKAFYRMSQSELERLVNMNYDFSHIAPSSAGFTPLMASIANSSNNEQFPMYLVNNVPNAQFKLKFDAVNVDGNNALMLAMILGFNDLALRILDLSDKESAVEQIKNVNDFGHSAEDMANESDDERLKQEMAKILGSVDSQNGGKVKRAKKHHTVPSRKMNILQRRRTRKMVTK